MITSTKGRVTRSCIEERENIRLSIEGRGQSNRKIVSLASVITRWSPLDPEVAEEVDHVVALHPYVVWVEEEGDDNDVTLLAVIGEQPFEVEWVSKKVVAL